MKYKPSSKTSSKAGSISRRFSFTLIGVVTLLLATFAIAGILFNINIMEKDLETRLKNAVKLAQISLPIPLWNLDTKVADDFVRALFLDKSIVYVKVLWGLSQQTNLSAASQIVTERKRKPYQQMDFEYFSNSSQFIIKSSAIQFEESEVGNILIVMSRESVRKQTLLQVYGIITLAAIIIAAIWLTSLFITKRYIFRPLLQLRESASLIAKGDLDTFVDKGSDDEIGILAQHLDVMRRSIKQLFEELRESKEEVEKHSRTLEQEVAVRTQELDQSVEELKALGEISQAVSSTLDLETVLSSIVRHAVQLSRADAGTIYEFDETEQIFSPRTNYGVSTESIQEMRESKLRVGDETVIGQAAEKRIPYQVPNLVNVPNYPLSYVKQAGFRALLALPLLHSDRLVGGLVVRRKAAGEFPLPIVDLLQTFAAQSVLAIHNAKLFSEIEEKGHELELADRLKSQFLANMSHEIRTPMNAIIGMTDLALGTKLTSKQREYLSVVRSSSRALLTLINDILDFSKIEAGKLEIEAVPFGLRDLLDDVADSFKVQVIKKEIEFVIATSVGAPEGLVGDPLRLRQVLVNLIGNAFKFTEKGQICLEVLPAGQAKRAEVGLNFTVSDTGIGIHRDEIDALRDAFTQADASTTRKFGGTGLGLSISNQLIQLMGGSGIGIESELGRGSSFSFNLSFPRYAAGEERDLIVPERIKGLRALIIEDNEASMKVLGQMLEHFGIRNEGAVTAEEGLALLSSEEGARRFGLVFIDWKLPGMDGLSAAEEIKNSETLKDLTIILMSAFGGEQEISKDGNKVVNGFLHKPFKHSTLFDTIMTAFGYTSRPEDLKYLAASEGEFEGIRVLLAEDNKANQQVACEVLFQAGFEVDVANNGREALEALRRREYAAVLMDVQMPVMDGYEATRRIRELEGSSQSSIPIIAITASAMKGDREKCLAAGMDDYISKPINRNELFRVLRKYLKAVGPPADSGLTAGDTAEDHPPLPDLQGIDVSEGLRRLGLSWERFSKLLLRFSGGQTEVFEELRQAVENGDRENIRLLAHSLAGAAGNISATALRKAAKDLEQAAAGDKGGDEAGLPEYSAAMEREFDVIISSIASLASVDDRTGIKPAPSSRLDLKQLLSYLQKLEPHLKRRYAKESGAIIDEISRLTWPEDLKDNLEELDGLVRKYRLKQAYPVLESIMKRLAEVKEE